MLQTNYKYKSEFLNNKTNNKPTRYTFINKT